MDKNKTFKSYTAIMGLMIFAAILVLGIINIRETVDFIKFIGAAILPFLLGFIIAYILNLIVNFYEKYLPKKGLYTKSLSRFFAILAALLTIIAILTLVALLAIPQLIHSLTILIQAIPSVYKTTLGKINDYLTLLPPNYQKIIAENINQTVANFNAKAMGNLLISNIIDSLRGVFHFVLNFALAFIFAIFILINKERLKKQIRRLGQAFLSVKQYQLCKYVLAISNETFANYIMGQFLEATILGCMVTLGLLVFGIHYPFSIGCAVGLLSLIPLLGAYLGGLMGVIMLLPLGSNQAMGFIIILVIIQQIESNLIYPRVVGGSIGLPGIWTFLAITLGGSLYGILGMIISVPLAAIIYKLIRNEVQARLEKNSPNKF